MDAKSPIGVFDSGVGGLTVLDQLIQDLPNEDFIYIGDNKHFPYGTKSSSEIKNLIIRICHYFENIDVKVIVIACNSASSHSSCLEGIIKTKVIEVIKPAAYKALNTTKTNNIALLGTELTVKSCQYKDYIEPRAKLYSLACTSFVDLVESNDLNNKDYVYNLVDTHLAALKGKNIDTIILGCTHFGLIADIINKSMPDTSLIDCSKPIAESLDKYLSENNLKNPNTNKGIVRLLTTGKKEIMESKIKWFKHQYQSIEEIEL